MTDLPPILVTGFERFGGYDVNPTEAMLEGLAAEPGIVTAVLPVVYATVAERFIALLDEHKPAAVLSFGVSEKTDFIVIERLAWNVDNSATPDNDGEVRQDVPIVEDGPTAYGGTLPVPNLVRELAIAGLPVTFGDHAGGFLCNHLFYRARHHMETVGPALPMAFLHVPPFPHQLGQQMGRQGMTLDRHVLAARTAVAWVRRNLSAVVV